MSEVVSVSEMFGKDVFNDAVMKDRCLLYTSQNRIKHNKKYNPASDTEKGKIPKMRAKIPFKTG